MTGRQAYRPEAGKVYNNAGGGQFRCIHPGPGYYAKFVNINSGWTFYAHGIGIYNDGSIDWDYSVAGHFEEVK